MVRRVLLVWFGGINLIIVRSEQRDVHYLLGKKYFPTFVYCCGPTTRISSWLQLIDSIDLVSETTLSLTRPMAERVAASVLVC
uniref:Secreted protein n=1 Tax=Rhipicephalus appendiculatus TaxID=34631 RepID=A0A131YAP9_RHIAP